MVIDAALAVAAASARDSAAASSAAATMRPAAFRASTASWAAASSTSPAVISARMASAEAAERIACEAAIASAAWVPAAMAKSVAWASAACAAAITSAASSIAATSAPTSNPDSDVRKPSPNSAPPVSAIASKSGCAQPCSMSRNASAVPGSRDSASAHASAGSNPDEPSLSGEGQWTLEGSATSWEDGHAAVSCGRGEGRVERRERGLVVDSHVQYAAVGQLEAGTRPQFGQAQRFVGVVRCNIHTGCSKVILHSRTAADPDAADQNLRHRDGVDERRTRCGVEQDGGCRRVVGIDWAEVSDQDTGVQNDHAGQSSRSSAR